MCVGVGEDIHLQPLLLPLDVSKEPYITDCTFTTALHIVNFLSQTSFSNL